MMTIHDVSSLDWSGDAGDVANAVRTTPYLVIGMCHIDVRECHKLSETIQEFRDELRLLNHYTFKFAKSSDRTRERFLTALISVDLSFTVSAVDRRLWAPSYVKRTSGLRPIVDAPCPTTSSVTNDA